MMVYLTPTQANPRCIVNLSTYGKVMHEHMDENLGFRGRDNILCPTQMSARLRNLTVRREVSISWRRPSSSEFSGRPPR
jgi:hypothetical protein